MDKTLDGYTERILGYVRDDRSLAVLAATSEKLKRLMTGVSVSRLLQRPTLRRWSVSEIVAHLADGEIVGAFRLRSILASPGTVIAAYDQDEWARSGRYGKRDPWKSLEQFHAVREGNLDLLAQLRTEEWEFYGIHSERGRESIERLVRMLAGHDINHVRQIEQILGGICI